MEVNIVTISETVYGHYFEYVEEATDFFSASRTCYDQGGSIAVPMNQEEQNYLQSNIK